MACIKNLSFQILTISRVEKPSRWQLTALKTRTIVSSQVKIIFVLLTYDGDDCAGSQGAAGHGDDGKLLLQPRHVALQLVLLSLRHDYVKIKNENILYLSICLIIKCLPRSLYKSTYLHRLEPLPDLRGRVEAGVWHRGGGDSLGHQGGHAAPRASQAHFTGSGLQLKRCDI